MRPTMPSGTPEGFPLSVMPFREDAVIGTTSRATLVRLVPSPRQEEDPRALKAASGHDGVCAGAFGRLNFSGGVKDGTPSSPSPSPPYAVPAISTGSPQHRRAAGQAPASGAPGMAPQASPASAQPSAGRKPSWRGARLTHGASTPLALIAAPLTRPRKTVLAVAATVVGCSLCACSTIGGTQTDTAPPTATVSASRDTQTAEDSQDTQDASDSDTFTVALDKTARWNNGVKAHLSGFSRGTSGEYASPSGKAYLAFSVTMQNDSKSSIDLSMVSLSCPDGADEIFDTDAGFSGTPDTHLLPGKSQTWKAGCVFPKTARSAQIEITPTDTSGSGWYRTAIFTGQVR